VKKCILTLSILFLSISSIFGALSIDDLINLSKNIGHTRASLGKIFGLFTRQSI